MEFYAKNFSELSAAELYEIIKSRTEVFLLEQNIVCQDLDDVDYESIHCFFKDEKRVIAYLRAFCSDRENGVVTVGRVLTLEHKKGLGSKLMQKSIKEIKRQFTCKTLTVHAQSKPLAFTKNKAFTRFRMNF